MRLIAILKKEKKNAKTKVKRRKDIQFLCRAIVFVSSGRKSEVRRHERELKKKSRGKIIQKIYPCDDSR